MIIFWCHAQVGARIEVDNLNVKHCSGPPLPEAVGDYILSRLYKYFYLYRHPH